MALHQYQCVVVTRCAVVRRQRQDSFEQQLSVIQYVTRNTYFCQQAHRFNMVAVPEQIGASNGFGRAEFTIGE